LRQAIRGGIIGGILSQALGPLLDILSPMLQVLQAFLAPVAAMLLRLFAPVLRFFLRLLPAWIGFVNDVPDLVRDAIAFIRSLPGRIWDFLSSLPRQIWQEISAGASWLADGAANIATGVWGKFRDGIDWLTGDLPSMIASKLAEKITGVVPNIRPTGGGGGLGSLPILGNPLSPTGALFDALETAGGNGGGGFDGNLGVDLRLDDRGFGELFKIGQRDLDVDLSP